MSTSIVTPVQEFEDQADFVGPPWRLTRFAKTDEALSPAVVFIDADNAQVDEPESDSSLSNAEPSDKKAAVRNLIRKFGSLSRVVRVAGVAAVVLSMCLFLLDGVAVVNDTQRFFTMLLVTGLLSAGGFALAFLLKEQRGARSFFGLALLSVPVNFTVLGALFYSVIQLDSVSTAYPTVAHWTIASVASLSSTAMIAAVVLIPFTVLGISTMGREGRVWLSSALLLSSSMLLLPVRDTSFIAPIVAVVVIALIGLSKKYSEGVISLKTPAGRFVQSLLFLPPAIMLVRSFWLYDASSAAALLVALTVYAIVRYASQRVKPISVICNSLHVVSTVVALVAATLAIQVFSEYAGYYFGALIFCLVFSTLMFDVEQRVKSSKLARILGVGTALVLALNILVYQQSYDGLFVMLGGILVLAILLGMGIAQKHKVKSLIACIALVSVMVLNAGGLIDLLMKTGWLGFASLGAIAIVAASLLERFGAVFSIQARKWFASVRTTELH